MYAGNADSIKIESEDNGFHMIVETEEGTFSFLIHGVAVDLLRQVREQIQPWWSEGQTVLAEMKRADAFRCSPEDVDESGGVSEHLAESRAMEQWKEEKDGYDLTDPQHPDFHSVHADIWDAREGK